MIAAQVYDKVCDQTHELVRPHIRVRKSKNHKIKRNRKKIERKQKQYYDLFGKILASHRDLYEPVLHFLKNAAIVRNGSRITRQ